MKANFGSRLNTLRRALGIMRRGIFFPMLLEFIADMESTGERWESASWREPEAQLVVEASRRDRRRVGIHMSYASRRA